MVRVSGTPSAAHTPVFQSVPIGTEGQAAMPTAAGRTACQMSTYGWPVISTQRPYVARTPSAVAEFRPGGGRRRQVVQAVDRLHDDALHAQVVPPDAFHQRGVVDAFHPDPRRLGGSRAQTRDRP